MSLRGGEAAVAVDELLVGSPGRSVCLDQAGRLLELVAELIVQLVGVIADHLEITAPFRPLGPESSDQNVTAGLDRPPNGGHVAAPIGLVT